MSGEELPGREAVFALSLETVDFQDAIPAGDMEGITLSLENRPGRCLRSLAERFGLPDFEEDFPVALGQVGKRSGPGCQGTNPARESASRPGPIQVPIFLTNFARIEVLAFGLRDRGDASDQVIGQRGYEQLCAQLGEAVMEALEIIGLMDRRRHGRNHVARIQPGIHLHQGDSGLGAVIANRPLDGGRAPIMRQERGVHIDAAQARNIQKGLGKYLPIRRDDDEVGLMPGDPLQRLRVACPARLEALDAEFLSNELHRRGLKLQFSPLGFIGLRNHARDFPEPFARAFG